MSISLLSNSEARPTLTSLGSTEPREAAGQATELRSKTSGIKSHLEAYLNGLLIPLTDPIWSDLFSPNPHEGLPVECRSCNRRPVKLDRSRPETGSQFFRMAGEARPRTPGPPFFPAAHPGTINTVLHVLKLHFILCYMFTYCYNTSY